MTESTAQEEATNVEVQRTLSAPLARVWENLMSPAGAEALLGHGARLGSKGESWHTDDGHRGVVRSLHPLEQLRVTWHETDDAPPSIVEIDVSEADGATALLLRHDRVRGDDVEADLAQWNAAIDRFEATLR